MSRSSLKFMSVSGSGGGGTGLEGFIFGANDSTDNSSDRQDVVFDTDGNIYMGLTSSDTTLVGSGSLQKNYCAKIAPDASSLTASWASGSTSQFNSESTSLFMNTEGTELYVQTYGYYNGSSNYIVWFKLDRSDMSTEQSVKEAVPNGWYTGSPRKTWTMADNEHIVPQYDYNSGTSSGGNALFYVYDSDANSVTSALKIGGSNNNGTNIRGTYAASTSGNPKYVYHSGNSAEGGQAADVGLVAKYRVDSGSRAVQWIQTYGTSSQNNYGTGCVVADSSGNVYSVYRYRDVGAGEWYPCIQKHNSSGTLQVEKKWACKAEPNCMTIDSTTGKVYMTGQVNNASGNTLQRCFVCQVNTTNLTFDWYNEFDGSGLVGGSGNVRVYGRNIGIDASGSLYVTFRMYDSTDVNGKRYGFIQGIDVDGALGSIDDATAGFEYITTTPPASPASHTSGTFSNPSDSSQSMNYANYTLPGTRVKTSNSLNFTDISG